MTNTEPLHISSKAEWEEFNAYNLGLQAYQWGYGWIYFSVLIWQWSSPEYKEQLIRTRKIAPWAKTNSFFYRDAPAGPEMTTHRTQNCDTLYAASCLNLSAEPLVLSVPVSADTQDILYEIQISAMNSDNVANVSTLTTGYGGNANQPPTQKFANYLIATQDWHGAVPDNVFAFLPRMPTPQGLVLARTGLRKGIDTADSVLKQITLTPLSRFMDPNLPAGPTIQPPTPPALQYDPSLPNTEGEIADPLNHWRTLNQALTNNPPRTPPGINQDSLLAQFATIGIGPGQNVDLQSAATKNGLRRAALDGYKFLQASRFYLGNTVGHWSYPSRHMGRAGVYGEYLTRSTMQAMWGIVANDPFEAVYVMTDVDKNGHKLDGRKKYTMSFSKDAYPPFHEDIHGFWSLTVYNDEQNIMDSDSYNINSYSDFPPDSDGGMTITLSPTGANNPGSSVYWLGTRPKKSGVETVTDAISYYLVFRVYAPKPEVWATQTWVPPDITPID